MLEKGIAPWPKGEPPELLLELVGDRMSRLSPRPLGWPGGHLAKEKAGVNSAGVKGRWARPVLDRNC
jgi:hypothetical protein